MCFQIELIVPVPNQALPVENSSRTVQKARTLFAGLQEELNNLTQSKMLPADRVWEEERPPLQIEDNWIERADPYRERCRVETPSLNAVLRLCYLTTPFNADKVPFTQEDLAAFVESKTTRNRTYFWFKWGMLVFGALCILQGFSNCIAPSIHPRDRGAFLQGMMNTIAGVIIAGLGVLFTGLNPDHSQDKLNIKVDRINRVKEKLDEVARTLIIFCYNKKKEVRQLAQLAAAEISIPNLAQAAQPHKYALEPHDVANTLILLKQAVQYIQEAKVPENPGLNELLKNTLKRKEELVLRNEWE